MRMQKKITECIIKLMKSNGITQSDLASVLNCTQTAVSNLLNGKSRLTIDDLDLISNKIGIPINELIAECNQYDVSPVNFPNNAEELVTENALAFSLLNKLKIPISLSSLFTELKLNDEEKLFAISFIESLRSHSIVKTDESGNYFADLNHERILHYRLTKKYWDRIIEIYKKLRPAVSNATKNQKSLSAWREKNVDAFYADYFTDEQIKKQNEVIRQFLDLVKHQIRMNRAAIKMPSAENKELRVVFTTLSSYPIKELVSDGY